MEIKRKKGNNSKEEVRIDEHRERDTQRQRKRKRKKGAGRMMRNWCKN